MRLDTYSVDSRISRIIGHTWLFQDSRNEKEQQRKLKMKAKSLKAFFKFDIEALLDKAQEWIIEVQQKMDGLTMDNIIPTLELDTATCGKTIHVMYSNKAD